MDRDIILLYVVYRTYELSFPFSDRYHVNKGQDVVLVVRPEQKVEKINLELLGQSFREDWLYLPTKSTSLAELHAFYAGIKSVRRQQPSNQKTFANRARK